MEPMHPRLAARLLPFYGPEKQLYETLTSVDLTPGDCKSIFAFWAFIGQHQEPILGQLRLLGREALTRVAVLSLPLAKEYLSGGQPSSEGIRLEYPWFPEFEAFFVYGTARRFMESFTRLVGDSVLWYKNAEHQSFSPYKSAALKGGKCVEGATRGFKMLIKNPRPRERDEFLFNFDLLNLQDNVEAIEDLALRQAVMNAAFNDARYQMGEEVMQAVGSLIKALVKSECKGYVEIDVVSIYRRTIAAVCQYSARVTVRYGCHSGKKPFKPNVYNLGGVYFSVSSRITLSYESEPYLFSHGNLSTQEIQEFFTGIFGPECIVFLYNRPEKGIAHLVMDSHTCLDYFEPDPSMVLIHGRTCSFSKVFADHGPI